MHMALWIAENGVLYWTGWTNLRTVNADDDNPGPRDLVSHIKDRGEVLLRSPVLNVSNKCTWGTKNLRFSTQYLTSEHLRFMVVLVSSLFFFVWFRAAD